MHLADDVVDGVLQRLRPRVEAGHGRQHDGAGLRQLEQPAQVDLRQRRLARHDDERPPLLERDVGGAVDERARRAEGDVRRRRHRARADDGGVRGSCCRSPAAPPRSSGAKTSAAAPARSRNAAVTASRPGAASSSSCSSTRTPLSEMQSCRRAAGRGQRLHQPQRRRALRSRRSRRRTRSVVESRSCLEAPRGGVTPPASVDRAGCGTGHRSSPCGPVPPLPWHFMQTLPWLYTWFGWSAMKALLCGSSTP